MPKCKNCKDIFEPKQFNRKYCTKDECNNLYFEFLKYEIKRKWNKEKKVKKENLQTVQELLKLAQVVFNKWIRKRDQENNLPCISCLNPKPKKVNAGHYFSSGGHKNVSFDPDNVHLQCEYCNTFLHGNLISYRTNLIERIGLKRYEALESKANITKKFTREELRELITEYKQKTK